MGVLKKSLKLFICPLIIWALGITIYMFLSQPPYKTDEIYSGALNLYKEENYNKAYSEFSKIIPTSSLKPLAIYHQGVCADKIGDIDAAVKQYKFFLKLYPKHTLALRVKYYLAQDLIDKEPARAKKYFENIIKSGQNSDYAIASEYYSGLLTLKKYKNEKIFPFSVKLDIENHFRHYLKKAPSGRHALNAINNWISLGKDITKDDYLLIANSYYLFGDYKKAVEFVQKADSGTSWALEVKIFAAMGDYSKAISLTEQGLKGNADYVSLEDIHAAIDTYINLFPSKYQAASKLIGISKPRGKDYIMAIKCRYSPANEKSDCYKNLYLWFPTSEFVEEAQAQIFLHLVRANDTENAKKLGTTFLNKYNNSTYTPMVMYYMGRLNERTNSYKDYVSYYKSVMYKYPDTYYAYRAYLRLIHSHQPIITSYIKEQPVEYPYNTRNLFLEKLVSLGDFEVLEEYCTHDDFIKSWVLYKKGDLKQSMFVARNAMDKLIQKPEINDLRWRLVYPLNYYDKIKRASDISGNIPPLMLSIVREESYFDPDAKSPAGAKGLMQLMPATASEIAAKHSISGYNLSNPDQNIMLGNYYYAYLRGLLGALDVSAIAAYNGGIGSVNRWKSSIYYQDTDSFIEQIPYPETQNYVKKVLRTYWNYIRIYDNGNVKRAADYLTVPEN